MQVAGHLDDLNCLAVKAACCNFHMYVTDLPVTALIAMHPCSERLAEMIHTAPCVWELLSLESRANLASCSQLLRHVVHSLTTVVTVHSIKDIHLLDRGNWPSLSLICISQQSFWPSWPISVNLELLAVLDLIHSKANTSDTRIFIIACNSTQPRRPPQALDHSQRLAMPR